MGLFRRCVVGGRVHACTAVSPRGGEDGASTSIAPATTQRTCSDLPTLQRPTSAAADRPPTSSSTDPFPTPDPRSLRTGGACSWRHRRRADDAWTGAAVTVEPAAVNADASPPQLPATMAPSPPFTPPSRSTVPCATSAPSPWPSPGVPTSPPPSRALRWHRSAGETGISPQLGGVSGRDGAHAPTATRPPARQRRRRRAGCRARRGWPAPRIGPSRRRPEIPGDRGRRTRSRRP
jgi:hypothetical protein